MTYKAQCRNRGFTLIELIVVILLLGIVSAVVMSRFVGGNAFNPLIVRDQIVSMARIAQQSALGRSNVSLTITPSGSGDSVLIELTDSGGVVESTTVGLTDVVLSGDVNQTSSCALVNGVNTLSNATPMTITFGSLGDLGISGVTGSTGAVSSALRICVNNNPSYSVCVSPSGFAYEGDCDV